MAKPLTDEESKAIIDQNIKDFQEKAASQQAEGKTFNVPADGHGPGVVPEASWQEKKRIGEKQ